VAAATQNQAFNALVFLYRQVLKVPLAQPHSVKYMAAPQNQFLMCSLRSLTCLQVQVLSRQWVVGPSSHSRPWLGETPTGASSAVNGRASRWRRLPARTGQPL
jgi:hypothetical protein